jgi:hypothetical protein
MYTFGLGEYIVGKRQVLWQSEVCLRYGKSLRIVDGSVERKLYSLNQMESYRVLKSSCGGQSLYFVK